VINAPGTIDADFRGEVQVLLLNTGERTIEIMPGERIAQMVIAPVVHAEIQEVSELGESARGTGGFGSTGRA
jgi:dUTP pyrophosphatase